MRSSRTTASFCSRRQDEGTLALPGVTASAQDHDESPARGNKRSSPTETLAVGHVTVLWGGDDLIGRMKELAKTQTIHRPPTAERIAQELVETIRNNVTVDWTLRESVRANMRIKVRQVLRKHGYPPDKAQKATDTVIQQAELLSEEWAPV